MKIILHFYLIPNGQVDEVKINKMEQNNPHKKKLFILTRKEMGSTFGKCSCLNVRMKNEEQSINEKNTNNNSFKRLIE